MLKRLRSRGLLYSIGMVINKVVPPSLFRARVFGIFELHASPAPHNNRITETDLTFRWCETPEDHKRAEELTFYRPEIEPSKHRACLAYQGEEAIGGVWIADGQFRESDLGVQIELAENQRWLFAAHINKRHRQKGVYRRLLEHVLTEHSDKQVFASINPTNRASIAAHAAYVERVAGTSWVVRVTHFAIAGCRGDLRLSRHAGKISSEPLKLRMAD